MSIEREHLKSKKPMNVDVIRLRLLRRANQQLSKYGVVLRIQLLKKSKLQDIIPSTINADLDALGK